MKHAVIICHPRGRAFTQLMAQTYMDAVRAEGHAVVERDLYAMGFDPRLQAEELPGGHGAVEPEILIERAMLKDVDVFALFYPIWFASPPAMMKGYVERIFGPGFGYEFARRGGTRPLLGGRKLVSFTSTGSENTWMVDSGSWDAVRKVFDQRIATVCGLESIEHVNFGGVDQDIRPAQVEEAVALVRETVSDLFAAGAKPRTKARRRIGSPRAS